MDCLGCLSPQLAQLGQYLQSHSPKVQVFVRKVKKGTSLKRVLEKITAILQNGNIMSFSFRCFQDGFGPNFPSVNVTGGK